MKKFIEQLKNPVVSAVLMIIVIVGLVLGGTFFYLKGMKGRISIENSLVNIPIIPVVPTTAGKLKTVSVIEGQKVKKGDALAVVGSEIVRSYDDGIVIETSKLIGSLVSPQTPIIKIVDPNETRISGSIDENKGLDKIRLGQVASFTVDALPGKTFWGYVDEVAPSAKQTSLSFSISSERPVQQFEVFVRFDANTYTEIKNGMSAKMIVFTDSN